MAKQPNTFAKGPWHLKKDEIHRFVKVTEQGRKNAIKYGRILYIIDSGSLFRGTLSVDPCFTKGYWKYPWKPWEKSNGQTHYRTFFPEDMDLDLYKRTNKTLIDAFIASNSLYINPTDPILTYFKE